MQTYSLFRRSTALAAVVVLAAGAAGCELGEQSAPPLSGPSELGMSVSVNATPDRLTQDGVSKSTITAFVRDADGKPINARAVQWDVVASDGTLVEPSWRTSLTDANGGTIVQITAPPAPATLPTSPLRLTITATPLSDNTQNANGRSVEVTLVPPLGTLPAPPANNPPVASFTTSPSTAQIQQTVFVDASATTDEGVACLDTCTYSWDFGDGGFDSGRREEHQYAAAGTYNIRLTVADPRGGLSSITNAITITAPAFTASFTVSPTAPIEDQQVNFDASGSTIGTGASIVSYTWIWGDGTPNGTTGPQNSHTYTGLTANATFVVRLILTDTLGRTATISSNVTVTNVP